MLTDREMIGFQAEKHDLIDDNNFATVEEYVLHLIHTRAYKRAAELAKGKSVLDIGCNTGYGTNILASGASFTAGIDVSERAILKARSNYSVSGIRFEVTDGSRIPFEDDSFDVVTSFQVIEHLVDCDAFISEAKRVLAPGGVVIFTTPNACIRLDEGMKPSYEFHVREYRPSELESELQRFFSSVEIFGLYAPGPLYSIEFNRSDTERKIQRRKMSGDTGPGMLIPRLRAFARKVLPEDAVVKLRGVQTPNRRKLLKHVMETYSAADFFYRTNDLDDALDLMAICSESSPA
jgi:SAM-dependent methyltransferase